MTGAIIGLLATAAAISTKNAVVIEGALALSSTAVVMYLLSERGEIRIQVGRVAFSIEVFGGCTVAGHRAGAQRGRRRSHPGCIMDNRQGDCRGGAIFAFGRLVLRPVFRVIAVGQTPEMFAAMPLMIQLGTSWATASLGLSLAIGGFIAGLLLAETEYRMQVAAEIALFRGLLPGLFFMTVSLDLDLPLIVREAGLAAGFVVSLIFGKTGLLAMVASSPASPGARRSGSGRCCLKAASLPSSSSVWPHANRLCRWKSSICWSASWRAAWP